MIRANAVAGAGFGTGHTAFEQSRAPSRPGRRVAARSLDCHAALADAKDKVPGLRTVGFGDGECPPAAQPRHCASSLEQLLTGPQQCGPVDPDDPILFLVLLSSSAAYASGRGAGTSAGRAPSVLLRRSSDAFRHPSAPHRFAASRLGD